MIQNDFDMSEENVWKHIWDNNYYYLRPDGTYTIYLTTPYNIVLPNVLQADTVKTNWYSLDTVGQRADKHSRQIATVITNLENLYQNDDYLYEAIVETMNATNEAKAKMAMYEVMMNELAQGQLLGGSAGGDGETQTLKVHWSKITGTPVTFAPAEHEHDE